MKDGNAHARKRMIDDLVEVRQKCVSCAVLSVAAFHANKQTCLG